MSQVQRLIARFDGIPLETEITVRDIQNLGIGPYSRRLEDARDYYLPLGFLILNRMVRRPGQSTLSFYRKVLASNYPEEHRQALEKAQKEPRVKPSSDTRHSRASWFEKEFRPAPKPKPEPEPEWSLKP